MTELYETGIQLHLQAILEANPNTVRKKTTLKMKTLVKLNGCSPINHKSVKKSEYTPLYSFMFKFKAIQEHLKNLYFFINIFLWPFATIHKVVF